jgi:hypothetical protein
MYLNETIAATPGKRGASGHWYGGVAAWCAQRTGSGVAKAERSGRVCECGCNSGDNSSVHRSIGWWRCGEVESSTSVEAAGDASLRWCPTGARQVLPAPWAV